MDLSPLQLKKLSVTMKIMTFKKRSTGYAKGYRSGLEEKIAIQIEKAGLPVVYEKDVILYSIPQRTHKYTPDWRLSKPGGFFYVESKGLFSVFDRAKSLYCVKQNNGLDLRFVFSNANSRLYKGSPTTYSAWCEQHGFRWANKWIPESWLEEARKGETGGA